jgi:hypothetical protein
VSDGHTKRMACQIAAQLPDDRCEALEVLAYVRDIVENLGGGWSALEGPRQTAALYVIPATSPVAAQEVVKAGPPGRLDKASRE